MNFAFPWCFLLTLPLAIAAWRMLRRGRRTGVRFAAVRRLPARTAGWRARVANFAPWLYLSGAALLVLASARPRSALSHNRRQVDAIAIAMAVDVSNSMNALDLTPRGEKPRTRLDVVKEMFSRFAEARPDDLIGLVTFGGYASSRAPLTVDHEALANVLKGVEIPIVKYDSRTGQPVDPEEVMTAVGDGLSVALARLVNAEVKSKIVILLSDGESNTGAVEPDDAAEAAAKLGIRVYTIGVGTNAARTPIRIRDMYGREQIVHAVLTFDEAQLKSIANKTGARYFAVRDQDGLAAALDEIDQLEKTPIDRTLYERWREYFPPFLVAGAFLVFLAVSLQMAASRRIA